MMQKIRRFRRILSTKVREEQTVQVELSERLTAEQNVLAQLDGLKLERQRALDEFVTQVGRVFSPRDLWHQRQHIECIDTDMECKERELAALRRAIEETKVRLLERHREVRMLENYVEKLQAADTAVRLSTAQNELDDLTCMRFNTTREEFPCDPVSRT
jgi:flagellar export protein FliJ